MALFIDKITNAFPYLIDIDMITNIVATKEIVIVKGNSGCGKSYFAELIHNSGHRMHKNCSKISLASLPSGLFESELFGHKKGTFTGASFDRVGLIEACDGGTLILEDIADISLENQAKFLQFLDTYSIRKLGDSILRKVDVRIICTTNENLLKCVKDGTLREDLYFRLTSGFVYKLPDLMTVKQVYIKDILKGFIDKKRYEYPELMSQSTRPQFSKDFFNNIRFYLKGNYRGLNKLSNLLAFSKDEVFSPDLIPFNCRAKTKVNKSLKKMKTDFLKEVIEDALSKCNGNQIAAARLLDISRNTVRKYTQEMI